MTRAPSLTNDAQLTEIERKFRSGELLSRTEAQAVFIALHAYQTERNEHNRRAKTVAIICNQQTERAEAAERERDRLQMLLADSRGDKLRIERDALRGIVRHLNRDALKTAVCLESKICEGHGCGRCDKETDELLAAFATRPPVTCEGCGVYPVDPPSKFCPGCQAYREHQA